LIVSVERQNNLLKWCDEVEHSNSLYVLIYISNRFFLYHSIDMSSF